jgi:N4-gp56 family major capsid protein
MNTGTGSWASGLQVEAWSKELYHEVNKSQFWTKFMGTGSNNVVQVKNELNAKKGDTIHFGLRARLSGNGVENDDTLEGNEEEMPMYDFSVVVSQLRNAVRSDGQEFEGKYLYSFRMEAMDALKVWLAETKDKYFFDALALSPTNFIGANGGATVAAAKAALTASTLLTPALISKAKARCKLPTVGHSRIRPVRVEGKNYYMMIISPEQAYDLKRNAEWLQAQREAGPRGSSNPIFTDALGEFDGVLLYEHEDVSTFDDGGGAAIHGCMASLVGAQALVQANNRQTIWKEKTFDYGNELGISGGFMQNRYASGSTGGNMKAVFNSLDFAHIAVYTTATNL